MNKLLLYGGILLLLLPVGMKIWSGRLQREIIYTYEKEVEAMEDTKLKECLEKAYQYNKELYLTGCFDEVAYEMQLNLFGNGIMGYLEIPKIDLKLPIYHGTEEEVLTNGIGHLKESSLPIGGVNFHSILTGHRGLPSSQLFTRLDELKVEDEFYITICGKKFEFSVIEIQVIRPVEVDVLSVEPGKEWVSLVTCTPYGINTHRLVVTGELIKEGDE